MCYVHNQWYDISCAILYVILVLQILWEKGFISYCFVTNSEVEESERGREGWKKVCITNQNFVLPPCAAVLCLRDRH